MKRLVLLSALFTTILLIDRVAFGHSTEEKRACTINGRDYATCEILSDHGIYGWGGADGRYVWRSFALNAVAMKSALSAGFNQQTFNDLCSVLVKEIDEENFSGFLQPTK